MRIDLSFPQEFTEIYNKFHQSEKGLKLLELEGFSRKHFDLPQMSREYFTQEYSADVSIDSNANSNDGESLNHNNYQSELTKPLLKLENYYLIFRELEKQHGTEKAQDLLGKIIDGTYYFHDSTAVQIPYCYAFSTSRLMNEGRKWGQLHSIPSKRAKSFMSQVIETVMDLSQEFAGAITPADMIVNYAYYAKKENLADKQIEQDFQSFVHIVNNKYRVSSQSPFTNISLFDRNNLELMFSDYMYPDASTPDFDYILKLQEIFANFFAKGDPLTGLPYRFPVCTFTLLIDKEKGYELDQFFLKSVAKYNYKKGNFNIYLSNSAGKVASCCRLTNDFNLLTGINSFGAGAAISIGSHRVVSINLPRLGILYRHQHGKFDREKFFKMLDERMDDVHELLKAHRSLLHKRADSGFLKFVKPHKYIDIDRSLFSTFGLAGINELMYNLFDKELVDEFGVNEDVKEIEKEIIEHMNSKAMEYAKAEQLPYNLEQVPGESLAVKFAQKDSIMFGNIQEFDLYSNQFVPLEKEIDIFDRIKIESEFCKSLSGGAIAHLNMLAQLPNPEAMEELILFALECGLEHFVINYCDNICEEGHIAKGTLKDELCSICGADIIESLTRVVGYFTFKSSWNKVRREIEHRAFSDII